MTTPNQASVSIAVSLAEIHSVLCPTCQQAVIDLLSAKAGADLFRQAIAAQLAPPSPPDPLTPSPPDPADAGP